jgi:hypothetical protein
MPVFKFIGLGREFLSQFAELFFGTAVEAIACDRQAADRQRSEIRCRQRIGHTSIQARSE